MTSENRHSANLGRRLDEARARHGAPDEEDEARGGAMGMAVRLGMEMVLAVCVAVFIGWGLDEWLGTAPWLLLAFVPLGMVAGIMNVVRVAKSMQPPARAEEEARR